MRLPQTCARCFDFLSHMTIPYYQVDAFTDHVFGGNPAGVCLLPSWLPDQMLQKIALENNLSETAFLVGSGQDFAIRWFTPTKEVDLIGHATLSGVARQPEQVGTLRGLMILLAALVEGAGIIGIVFSLAILFLA